jgi:hypothetical protein
VRSAVGIVVGVSGAVFLLFRLVLFRPTPESIPDAPMTGELDLIRWHATHLASLRVLPLLRGFPGLPGAFAFAFGSSLVLLVGAARRRFLLVLARLAGLVLVTWVVFVIQRNVHAPFLILAAVLPCLDQLVRRSQPVLVGRLLLGAFLVLVPLAIAGPRPDAAADAKRQEVNANRDAHLLSMMTFLDRVNASAVLVNDPMLTLLDTTDRRYYLIHAIPATPAQERQLIDRFLVDFHARHLVTTPFGQSGWVRTIGMPSINQALHARPLVATPFDVDYGEGHGFHLRRLFTSTGTGAPQYQYGDHPSTPLTVLSIAPKP